MKKMATNTRVALLSLATALTACSHGEQLTDSGFTHEAETDASLPLASSRFQQEATLISANMLMELDGIEPEQEPTTVAETPVEEAPTLTPVVEQPRARQLKIEPVALPARVEPKPVVRGGPIRTVVRHIVPESIEITFENGFDQEIQVEYVEGRDWIKNLSKIGKKHYIDFDIVGDDLLISRSAVTYAAAPKPAPKGTPQIVVDGKPVSNALVRGDIRFIVREGGDLKSTLEQWNEAFGWTIRWFTDHEYPIEANHEFKGPFKDAAKELLGHFAEAEPPISAKFFKNNVIVIRDANSLSSN